MENAVYPLGLCAERTAVVKAVSEGFTQFTAIAVVRCVLPQVTISLNIAINNSSNSPSAVPPCGACRQVLAEFSTDMLVVMAGQDGHLKVSSLLQPTLISPYFFTTLDNDYWRVASQCLQQKILGRGKDLRATCLTYCVSSVCVCVSA